MKQRAGKTPQHHQPKPRAVARQWNAEPPAGSREPKASRVQDDRSGLPADLRSGIETLSGYSMRDVKVHYNSPEPGRVQAQAYARGSDIYLARGQERHLAHEAWHVVQQKQGRVSPTLQMKGDVSINDDGGLEHEADVMGARALHLAAGVSDPNAPPSTPETRATGSSGRGVIQRYTTKPNGLSVVGELHTKSPEHREVEKQFARYLKRVAPPALCYWQEPEAPGTGRLADTHHEAEDPDSSENADHFLAWDIDRIKHHYRLIASVLSALPGPTSQAAPLDKVQAAQLGLSASSMLETLGFLKGDLRGRDGTFDPVRAIRTSIKGDFNRIFNGLLEGAKAGTLSGELRTAFETTDFATSFGAIDEQLTKLLPDMSATRPVSYDFTRTVAMNELANRQKGTPGVWVIGEYHVQEIEEHLPGRVEYDLVSMHDFNADVKEYDESVGGSTIEVDHLGELLTLSRRLAANLAYFLRGDDARDTMDGRLAHWGRCMDVLFALETLATEGLGTANVSARLPGGVTMKDLLALIQTIHVGLDRERRETLAFDFEHDVLPEDLYRLMRDPDMLKAAKSLNILSGLAEFSA